MKLDGSSIGPYAGNGREDIVDGPLLPRQAYQSGFASFAQPSGLTTDGTWLFVADSEGSSIRAVPLDPRKEVRTVVGTSRLSDARLFTFGDVDGPALLSRFQHPLGVAFYEGQLYVADTYNSKIRRVDPVTGVTSTMAGTGKAGSADEPAAFDQPAGIAAAAKKLYVADTNNHLIRVVDLATKKVSTLPIAGLDPPKPPAEKNRSLAGAIEEKTETLKVRPENGNLQLAVEIELPPGYKINPIAPMAYRLENVPTGDNKSAPGTDAENKPISREKFGKAISVEKPAAKIEIRLPLKNAEGHDTVRLILDYYYCREGAEGICKAGTVYWNIPLEISAAAEKTTAQLRHRVR
jgi:hypothetical protein